MRKTILRITMLLMMFVGITNMANAQQVSKEQIKELVKASAIDMSGFKSDEFVSQMARQARMSAEQESKLEETMSKLRAYLNGPFYDDCSEILYPYYSKYLTVTDVDYLLKEYKSPNGIALIDKNSKILKAFMPSMMNYLQKEMPEKMQKVKNGKKIDGLKYKGSKSFEDKWNIMMKESGSDKIIDAVMDNISRQIEAVAQNDKSIKDVKTLVQVLVNDVFVVFSDVADDIYTEADLDYSIALIRSEAGQHLKAGNFDMMNNYTQMSQELTAKVREAMK